MNPVTVRNIKIGEGIPKICVPVVGVTKEEILAEARKAVNLPVDLLEWRGDWYEHIVNLDQMRETLEGLRNILGEMPLLFTFRTKREGGEKKIGFLEYEKLNQFVIETGYADMIDVEFFIEASQMVTETTKSTIVGNLLETARAHGAKVIASNHDFEKTPPKEVIVNRLCMMQEAGADMAKIAVMPRSKADVLTLLEATEEMCRLHTKTPVVTMSMSGDGMISRLCGEIFGSAITFGSAGKASAPGQIDVEELRKVLDIIHSSNKM